MTPGLGYEEGGSWRTGANVIDRTGTHATTQVALQGYLFFGMAWILNPTSSECNSDSERVFVCIPKPWGLLIGLHFQFIRLILR